MNQTALLHIVERLESLLARLPETIRKPVLRELTPLKELFLQQRPPRLLFTGSSRMPMPQIVESLFSPVAHDQMSVAVTPVHRWTDWNIRGHGTISILDARDAVASAEAEVKEELERKPADVVFVVDEDSRKKPDLEKFVGASAKIVVVSSLGENRGAKPEEELTAAPGVRDSLLKIVDLSSKSAEQTQSLMSLLARELPNEAKIEMIRISRDRAAQREVAHVLVKSTTAICTGIGAQPIPLADLPILTTLQLVMVAGIMHIGGRERSLRAATEFVGALGANVGVAMLLREGARAILKFFPGWGNVVCGMVAGAGTYAIGRAATAYFLEGVSLKEARRTYLTSRRKRQRALPERG